MSYESKVLVINRRASSFPKKISESFAIGQELARFDLSCMGHDTYDGKMFRDLFSTPIDFDIYVNHTDEVVDDDDFYRTDCYGEVCKYTKDINSIIHWLEEAEKHEHYRRAKMFLDFLKSFKDQINEYDEICIVHYGY